MGLLRESAITSIFPSRRSEPPTEILSHLLLEDIVLGETPGAGCEDRDTVVVGRWVLVDFVMLTPQVRQIKLDHMSPSASVSPRFRLPVSN